MPRFLLLTLLLATPAAFADPEAGEDHGDYSTALDQLNAMGIPDVRNASPINDQSFMQFLYSEAVSTYLSGPHGIMGSGPHDLNQQSPYGTTWQLPTADDTIPGHLLLPNLATMPPLSDRMGGREPRLQTVKIETAFAKVKSSLETIIGNSDQEDEVELARFMARQYPDFAGTALIFAAQLRRLEMDDEANHIAHLSLQAAANPSNAINQALNIIANNQIRKAGLDFFDHYDWDAYQQNVAAILERFTHEWPQRPVALLLQQSIVDRQSSLPDIEFPDPTYTPPDGLLDAIEALISHRGHLTIPPIGSAWLLTPFDDEDSPLHPILKHGIHALPVLAALCDAQNIPLTMTWEVGTDESISRDAFRAGRYTTYYSQRNTDPIATLWGNLTRPQSIGELCAEILQHAIPNIMDSNAKPDLARAANSTHQFWLLHKDDTPNAIARSYLDSSAPPFQVLALQFLSTNATPEDILALENQLLEANASEINELLVTSYLQIRGDDAARFFERLTKQTEESFGKVEDLAPGDRNEYHLSDGRRNPHRILSELGRIVNLKSIPERVDELLNSNATTEEIIEEYDSLLRAAVEFETPIDFTNLIIQCANIEDDELRLSFLWNTTSYASWSELDPQSLEWDNETFQSSIRKLIESDKKIPEKWKFSVSISTQGEFATAKLYGALFSNEAFAWLLEYSSAIDNWKELADQQILAMIDGNFDLPFEGTPLSDEQWQEIETSLHASSTAEAMEQWHNASAPEKVRWMHYASTTDKPPKAFSEVRNTITKISADGFDNEELNQWEGQQINAENIDEITSLVCSIAISKEFAEFGLTFRPHPSGIGLDLVVRHSKTLSNTDILNHLLKPEHYSEEIKIPDTADHYIIEYTLFNNDRNSRASYHDNDAKHTLPWINTTGSTPIEEILNKGLNPTDDAPLLRQSNLSHNIHGYNLQIEPESD